MKAQCFCDGVMRESFARYTIAAHDGWIFCVCSIFVFTVFTLLLLTGDCGGSDDYDCIPGSLLAQCFGASPPQDFPPLYFAAST